MFVCINIYFVPSVIVTTSYMGLLSMHFKTYYKIICWDELKKQSWGISRIPAVFLLYMVW